MKLPLNLKPLVELSVFAAVAYVLHQAGVYFFATGQANSFYYPTFLLYALFYIASLIIVGLLLFIYRKNIDNVGYAFMGLTCIKMVFAYLLLRPILNSAHPYVGIEKLNFFVVFIVFLIFETVVTARLLNR